ncbi:MULTISPECIES: hypothetical protein [Brasilonema]|nr:MULTISPECIES: hypothetical protein [Brasilonema]
MTLTPPHHDIEEELSCQNAERASAPLTESLSLGIGTPTVMSPTPDP